VLSQGNNVKRAKRGTKWVDLYAKPEKIDKKVVSKSKVSKKSDASKTQNQNPAQQSMSGVKWVAEMRLSLILGVDRSLWAPKLKAERLSKRKISQQNKSSIQTTEPLFAQETG